jgi:hypothetical protein
MNACGDRSRKPFGLLARDVCGGSTSIWLYKGPPTVAHLTSVQQRTSWTMAGFTLDSINPAFLNVEHAVRGELAIKAQEYRVRLAAGASDLPFTKVIFSNAGNPQEKGLDQKPLTFLRQARRAPCRTVCGWLMAKLGGGAD